MKAQMTAKFTNLWIIQQKATRNNQAVRDSITSFIANSMHLEISGI
jgi:hypothetical protein